MSFESELPVGEDYERYLVGRFNAEGTHVVRYETRADQLAYGDLRLGPYGDGIGGVEVKYDRLLHRTGNCFIEVAAKRRVTDQRYIAGGLNASANWSWFWIGDYRDLYIFRRRDLVQVRESDECQVFEIAGRTSLGFLLSSQHIDALAVERRHWPDRRPLGERA
jgi:hypothetical protein